MHSELEMLQVQRSTGEKGVSFLISLNILPRAEQLDAYIRRPDCFRTVASSIRSKCTDLETEQNERVQGKEIFFLNCILISQGICSCYLFNHLRTRHGEATFYTYGMYTFRSSNGNALIRST